MEEETLTTISFVPRLFPFGNGGPFWEKADLRGFVGGFSIRAIDKNTCALAIFNGEPVFVDPFGTLTFVSCSDKKSNFSCLLFFDDDVPRGKSEGGSFVDSDDNF